MAEWVPINQNHAIEVMAAVLILHEPLPQILQRKAFRATEEIAFEMGLRSRHVLSNEQILVPGLVIQRGPNPKDGPPGGYIFNSVTDDPETQERITRPTEQIEIRGNSIVYRSWNYVSWSWNSSRMYALMRPFIEASFATVSIQSIRLEYLDRFVSNVAEESPDVASLLRKDCQILAPQVFSGQTQWHSHSGFLLSDEGGIQRISLANVETNDVARVDSDVSFRSVTIMTAIEDRHSLEIEAQGADLVHRAFDEMHEKLKCSLANIITENVAEQIYLKS